MISEVLEDCAVGTSKVLRSDLHKGIPYASYGTVTSLTLGTGTTPVTRKSRDVISMISVLATLSVLSTRQVLSVISTCTSLITTDHPQYIVHHDGLLQTIVFNLVSNLTITSLRTLTLCVIL